MKYKKELLAQLDELSKNERKIDLMMDKLIKLSLNFSANFTKNNNISIYIQNKIDILREYINNDQECLISYTDINYIIFLLTSLQSNLISSIEYEVYSLKTGNPINYNKESKYSVESSIESAYMSRIDSLVLKLDIKR